MIQVKDLRIGNWVGMNVVGPVRLAGIPSDANPEELYPIPLTDKMLNEMGFQEVAPNVMSLAGFFVEYDGHAGYGIYMGNHLLRGIEYVHELQNVVHALTGNEINVEL